MSESEGTQCYGCNYDSSFGLAKEREHGFKIGGSISDLPAYQPHMGINKLPFPLIGIRCQAKDTETPQNFALPNRLFDWARGECQSLYSAHTIQNYAPPKGYDSRRRCTSLAEPQSRLAQALLECLEPCFKV